MATQTDRLGGAKGSLAYKAPCVAASTGNLTLSAAQTVDGVSVVAEDRVLVKDQTTASENGIYVCKTAGWERGRDFDGNDDIVKGTRVAVTGGTVGEGEYKVTTANPIVIGTTSVAFQLSVRDGNEPGFKWNFDSATTDADPGSGEFRFNNATLASATAAYIDNADIFQTSVTAWLDTLDDSSSTNKGTIKFQNVAVPTTFAMFYVTGSVVDGTGYRKLTLTHLASNGTFTAGDTFAVVFQPSGSAGSLSGPASSTTGNLLSFSSTGGNVAQDTGIASTNVVRASDIGSTAGGRGVQAFSTSILQEGSTGAVLSAGFPSTSENLGTLSTAATLTLNLRNGHFQHVTIQAAIAIAPQTDVGSIVLEVTNGSTASAITSTAYTRTVGAFSQVSGDDFLATSIRTQNFSLLSIQPLQST
jgi:hypothetical protein